MCLYKFNFRFLYSSIAPDEFARFSDVEFLALSGRNGLKFGGGQCGIAVVVNYGIRAVRNGDNLPLGGTCTYTWKA